MSFEQEDSEVNYPGLQPWEKKVKTPDPKKTPQSKEVRHALNKFLAKKRRKKK